MIPSTTQPKPSTAQPSFHMHFSVSTSGVLSGTHEKWGTLCWYRTQGDEVTSSYALTQRTCLGVILEETKAWTYFIISAILKNSFSDCINTCFKLQSFLNTNWYIYSYLSLINLGSIPHCFLEEMGEILSRLNTIPARRVILIKFKYQWQASCKRHLPCKGWCCGCCWMWNDLLPCHSFFWGKSSNKAIYHSATHLFISTCLSRLFQDETSTDFIPQTTWDFTWANDWLWSFNLQVSINSPPPSDLYLGIQQYSKFHHLFHQNHKDFMIKSSLCWNIKKFPGACQSFRPLCHNNAPLTTTTIMLY